HAAIPHYVNLHTVPTRRSSDLYTWAGREIKNKACMHGIQSSLCIESNPIQLRSHPVPTSPPNHDYPKRQVARSCPDQSYARKLRSEEHTSELQSPYDIVCRLLH